MAKMKEMTGRQRQILLAAFFPLIFIPAFILAYFAFGAVNQDEYIQRRRLEDSLLLELDQTNGRIQFTMEEIQEELYRSLPAADAAEGADRWAAEWKAEQDLANSVFILNGEGEILFPELDESDEANLFYWRYLNFFAGRESIPVYRNIAEEYQEEILSKGSYSVSEESAGSAAPEAYPELQSAPEPAKKAAPADTVAAPLMAEPVEESLGFVEFAEPMEESQDFADFATTAEADWEEAPLPEAEPESSLLTKEAVGRFQADPVVQERVYELAEQEGQQYLERNVLPQLTVTPREEETQTVVRSVYMESTRYFEEIIQSADYGLIPRLFDSTFILLFWARQGDRIVGCELEMSAVKDRMAEAVAVPANSVRVLNILDNGGDPLIPYSEMSREEWRRPFVAKEISEFLPYWETAILLNDPEEFQRQLDSSRYLLTFMITALTAVLLAAMIVIFRLSSHQLREVQQRVGFVTNVTHELKTPLTSIRLYSEMLSEGFQTDPDRVVKYSGYIAAESKRLSRLISNVLDFAKWDRGSKKLNRETLELNSLAGEVLDDLREEYARAGFTLDFLPSPDPLIINADREAIIQVLLNLLSNGKKYSEEQKEITVTTGTEEGKILLNVMDRGIGIPRKYRKKIFREFYRIDTTITTRYKGTGLGLAIAVGIMKNHSGSLTFAPRDKGDYRGGSCFTLMFPPVGEKGEGK